jgi:hypothetical protein
MTPAGLPHSDTPGSQLGCQLPRAYRRLQRPSSALDAKASTMCPSQLVSQTLNKNHKETQPHHPHNQGGSRALQKQTDNNQKTWSSSDARVHYPLLKHHTHQPHPPAQAGRRRRRQNNQPHPRPPPHTWGPPGGVTGLIPQGPTVCQNQLPHPHPQVPHPQPQRAGRRY